MLAVHHRLTGKLGRGLADAGIFLVNQVLPPNHGQIHVPR
jgi:hypothetical protein